jgi:hypothetical protein
MTATISSNEGAISRPVAAAGRRCSTAGRPWSAAAGSVHVDRDPVHPGARVEGGIRETDDDVLIIDSTPS